METQWIFVVSILISGKASGQCTFPSPFTMSTWHDSTRGTLVFTNTTVTGWNITVFTTTLSTWQCLNNSDPSRLVMKSTETWSFAGKTFHVYACLKVTEVAAGVSYTYTQLARQELYLGRQNRLKFHDNGTLTYIADICDETVVIPTLDFHVLVKSGSEAAAAISVPDRFLFSADYNYIATDLTVSCNATNDTFDMCTSTSALAITYSDSTCTQKIAYSAGGAFYSVVNVSMTSYDCVVFYNRDATITGSYTRFTCICSDGDVASVAPSNCTINQTPTDFPTEADMMTAKGHKIEFKTVHTTCPKTTNINECAANPCKNGATCNNLLNKYTCTCTGGWQGTNCDQDIDECVGSPCKNGATCINGLNKYTCTCAGGWQGTNCDQAPAPAKNNAGAIAGGVTAAIIVVAVVVLDHLKDRKLRDCLGAP